MQNGSKSTEDLLVKLEEALRATASSLPDSDTIKPPSSGISLLDVKNELLLSYLQNLVFLIIHRLRQQSDRGSTQDAEGGNEQNLTLETTKKLAELRVYLERGVRPLEGRLKYQIDKVLRAAETAERKKAKDGEEKSQSRKRHIDINGGPHDQESDGDESASSVDDLAFRPNPAAFISTAKRKERDEEARIESNDGIYRPPRFMPTSLPSTDAAPARGARRPQRSAAIDDYIDAEMSAAPMAEPSIGSTILAGGRRTKSTKERKDENERTAYEEANFTRLPAESKKERARKRKPERGFGGEELSLLGDDLGRIGRLTKKRKGGMKGSLTEDGPRGNGFAGDTRQVKKKRRKM